MVISVSYLCNFATSSDFKSKCITSSLTRRKSQIQNKGNKKIDTETIYRTILLHIESDQGPQLAITIDLHMSTHAENYTAAVVIYPFLCYLGSVSNTT